ncbi:MAG: hypothetical protein GY754_10770 [bacterium]|nr:hypothetical protein [bacterium]
MTDELKPLPVQEKKSKAPKVFGILLIVFGSIYVLYGIIPEFFVFRRTPVPEELVLLIKGVLKLVAVILSIVALVAGIGLVRYKEKSGRKLSLVWGCSALVYLVIETVIHIVVILPMDIRALPVFDHLFYQVYLAIMPILIVVMMTRPSAKKSCKG